MVRQPSWKQERPVSAPAMRPVGCHPTGGLGASNPISRQTAKWARAERESERPVLCAGRRMFQAGGNPARPPSKRGLKPKAGVTPRRAWLTSREEDKLELAMVYGDGEMCAEQETLGMCARRLRVVDSNESTRPFATGEPTSESATQAASSPRSMTTSANDWRCF